MYSGIAFVVPTSTIMSMKSTHAQGDVEDGVGDEFAVDEVDAMCLNSLVALRKNEDKRSRYICVVERWDPKPSVNVGSRIGLA